MLTWLDEVVACSVPGLQLATPARSSRVKAKVENLMVIPNIKYLLFGDSIAVNPGFQNLGLPDFAAGYAKYIPIQQNEIGFLAWLQSAQ